MDKKELLTRQVKKIIIILEREYSYEIKKDIFRLIYRRYKNALDVLENNKDLNKIYIVGGVRAYLDSYSNHQDPFLTELYEAERLLKELI